MGEIIQINFIQWILRLSLLSSFSILSINTYTAYGKIFYLCFSNTIQSYWVELYYFHTSYMKQSMKDLCSSFSCENLQFWLNWSVIYTCFKPPEYSQWVEQYSVKQLNLSTYVWKMIKIMADTNLWWHCYSCPHDYCYWLNPQCTSWSCRKTEVARYSAPRHSLHHYVSHTASTFFINN